MEMIYLRQVPKTETTAAEDRYQVITATRHLITSKIMSVHHVSNETKKNAKKIEV